MHCKSIVVVLRINRNTNLSRRKNGICNAEFAKKQDLSCMIAISTSTILLHRIMRRPDWP